MRLAVHPGSSLPSSIDRATLLIVGSFVCLAAAALAGKGMAAVAVIVALGAATVAWHRVLLRWQTAIGLIIAVVLFVPIGRYSFRIDLPFQLELYRVAVAGALGCWMAALLVHPQTRLRRSPFDIPLALILTASLASDVVNIGRVIPLQPVVLKAFTFFLSFILLHYLILSVVKSRETIERITKFLVSGIAVVAIFAVVEQRTAFNLFDHVSDVVPVLQFDGPIEVVRAGLIRSVGSAQHPIALGVLFAMAVPLGLALAFGSGRRWAIPTGCVLVGVMSSASRTPVVVLIVMGLVITWLKPREAMRLLPLLLPLVIVVKLLLPGSIATLKNSFFPEGGLVQQQTQLNREADPMLAGGRVRLIGPSLREASARPVLGLGFATRQTGFNNPLRNAPILDNQWLGLLLEIGIVGVLGWAMLFVATVRRLGRASRRRAGPEGWLPVGFAAATAGFGAGMFTYDSLSFVQIAFVFWIVISLAAALLLADADEAGTELSPNPSTESLARRVAVPGFARGT
jgi:polysaccharide biosynthesis protein PslJ